jgi:hypothetical protein
MEGQRKMRKSSGAPHPLQDIVWSAFEKRAVHDVASISYHLAGAIVRPGSKAYRMVAKDVLGYMEDQGLIYRDAAGWYRRKVEAA